MTNARKACRVAVAVAACAWLGGTSLTGPVSAGQTATYEDYDGLPFHVRLRGPGTFELVQDTQNASVIQSLTLAGTTGASRLSIDVPLTRHGRAYTRVLSMSCPAPLGELKAPWTAFEGEGIDLPGGVRSLTTAEIRSTVRVGADPRRRLAPLRVRAVSFSQGAALLCPERTLDLVTDGVHKSTIHAGAVRRIVTRQIDGTIRAATKIGFVSCTGEDLSGVITAREVGTILVRSDRFGFGSGGSTNDCVVAALRIGRVRIAGSLLSSHVLAGTQLGDDAALGGSGADADTVEAGTLGPISVRRGVNGSILGAGYDPADGVYRNGDDGIVGGRASRVLRLTLGGLDDDSVIGAGRIGPVRVARRLLRPDGSSRWVTRAIP